MAHADGKVLVLGAFVGVAGLGLAFSWYRDQRSRRRRSYPGSYLNRTNEQTASVVLADVPNLPRGQAEVLERLEALIQSVSELKDEMKALKNALPALQGQVREELGGRDGAEARRGSPHSRSTPTRRKRPAGSASGTRAAHPSSEEAESEGGYMTALTDSEEGEKSESEESGDALRTPDELSALLERIDLLHRGTESDKRESLSILQEQREENSTFLWRLIRAHCDVHDISSALEEKKTHAATGKKVGEEAVTLNPRCAESHQWYAIMCGIMAEYDTVQNKIKNGYIFKDHLDKAIQLKPQDPMSYYLLGRWCYAVAQLSWLERKVAATLFGEPPSATVEEALINFLKVEEIQPAYSKLNYVFLAKCYKDVGQKARAREMCEAARSMKGTSKEEEEAQKELELLSLALGM